MKGKWCSASPLIFYTSIRILGSLEYILIHIHSFLSKYLCVVTSTILVKISIFVYSNILLHSLFVISLVNNNTIKMALSPGQTFRGCDIIWLISPCRPGRHVADSSSPTYRCRLRWFPYFPEAAWQRATGRKDLPAVLTNCIGQLPAPGT